MRIEANVDPSHVIGFDGVVAHISRSKKPVLTDEFKQWMWSIQNGECGYCGSFMNPSDSPAIEHIQPRIRGGSLLPPNVMWACKRCNSQKKDRHYSFMRLLFRLEASGIAELISVKQAEQLLCAGIDLQFPPEAPLHFEKSAWPHVLPYRDRNGTE